MAHNGQSKINELAAEKQETTGAPSRPLPMDQDGSEPALKPAEQKMDREQNDKRRTPKEALPKPGKNVVYVEKDLKDWHSNWWEIWKDPTTSVYGCCLPCALVGMNVNRVSDGSSGFWKPFIYECLLLGPVFGWAYTYHWRKKLRDQNDLKAAPFNDCLTAFLCHQCALCQETREIHFSESDHISGPTKPTIDRGLSGKL